MSKFSGLLKKSIAGAEEHLAQVHKDLHEIVGEVNQAIKDDEGGLAELKLDPITEQLTGGLYRLSIEDRRGLDADRNIVDFMMGENGYPIQVLVPGSSSVLDTLPDKDALVRYFAQMLTASNSPIVVFLAFIKRQLSKEENSAPEKAAYAISEDPPRIVVSFKDTEARARWINNASGRRTITVAELRCEHGWRYPFYQTVPRCPNPPDVSSEDVFWSSDALKP